MVKSFSRLIEQRRMYMYFHISVHLHQFYFLGERVATVTLYVSPSSFHMTGSVRSPRLRLESGWRAIAVACGLDEPLQWSHLYKLLTNGVMSAYSLIEWKSDRTVLIGFIIDKNTDRWENVLKWRYFLGYLLSRQGPINRICTSLWDKPKQKPGNVEEF